MLLIDEEIFKKALERVFKQEYLFENFKQSLFCKLEERKSYIIKRLVKTQVDEKLRNSRVPAIRSLPTDMKLSLMMLRIRCIQEICLGEINAI